MYNVRLVVCAAALTRKLEKRFTTLQNIEIINGARGLSPKLSSGVCRNEIWAFST